jgi:hypothetical protein
MALVFWKCGNYLFHAAAVFKHFQVEVVADNNLTSWKQKTPLFQLALFYCNCNPEQIVPIAFS